MLILIIQFMIGKPRESLEVHNLFTLNYLCHLEVKNCDIKYQTKIANTFLFSGNISLITINNTQLDIRTLI